MKQLIDFVNDMASNSKFYQDALLLEKLTNIYIRMMPNEFVEVTTF